VYVYVCVYVLAYSCWPSAKLQTELAMLSTVDWMDGMSTKFPTESNASEDVIRAMRQRDSGIANAPVKAGIIAIAAAGILTNLVVLFGFWLAGRSKMNVSSMYIANHTTAELFTCLNLLNRLALEFGGVLKNFKYSGPAGTTFCIFIRASALTTVGAYAGDACIVIHALDRYWKIVHPIHHRKYYRRWMTYLGMTMPWLLAVAVKFTMTAATTCVVNGVCRPRAFWASEAASGVCQLSQFGRINPLALFISFDLLVWVDCMYMSTQLRHRSHHSTFSHFSKTST